MFLGGFFPLFFSFSPIPLSRVFLLFLLPWAGFMAFFCQTTRPRTSLGVYLPHVMSDTGGSLYLVGVLDSVSLSFLVALGLVASTCHGLSASYLYQPAPRKLFFAFYLLFFVSMVGLILAGDLFSLILFWDGLGITRFFLVSIFNRSIPRRGGLLTLLTNRLGDVCLILGTGALWASGGHVYRMWCVGGS